MKTVPKRQKKIHREILNWIMRFFSESENGPICVLIHPRLFWNSFLRSKLLISCSYCYDSSIKYFSFIQSRVKWVETTNVTCRDCALFWWMCTISLKIQKNEIIISSTNPAQLMRSSIWNVTDFFLFAEEIIFENSLRQFC